MSTKRYPFDYDAMEKGDYIPADRIEHIVGIQQTDIRYGMALMNIRDQIESELWSRGKQFTVKTERGGVVLMDDASASVYNHNRGTSLLRGAVKAHVRNLAVDVGNLTPDQRKGHDRYIEVDGKTIQAIASVRPHLVPSAIRRTVPGLPSKRAEA